MKALTNVLLVVLISAVTACNCACGSIDRDNVPWQEATTLPADTGSETGETSIGSETSDTGGESSTGSESESGVDEPCVSFCDPKCPENVAARYLVRDAQEDATVTLSPGTYELLLPHFFCDGGITTLTIDTSSVESELVVRDTWDAWLGGTAAVSADGCGDVHVGEVWDVNIELVKPAGIFVSPKRDLLDPDVNQPTSTTNSWQYWLISDVVTSTLKKQGSAAKATLTRRPVDGTYGFQLGDTASGKNMSFGASAGLYYDYTTAVGQSRVGQGVVNVNVREICNNLL